MYILMIVIVYNKTNKQQQQNISGGTQFISLTMIHRSLLHMRRKAPGRESLLFTDKGTFTRRGPEGGNEPLVLLGSWVFSLSLEQ